MRIFKPTINSISVFNKDGIAISDIKNIDSTDALLVTYKDGSQEIFENYKYFIDHAGYKEEYNPTFFESVNILEDSVDYNIGDIIYFDNEFITLSEDLLNSLEVKENYSGTVKQFSGDNKYYVINNTTINFYIPDILKNKLNKYRLIIGGFESVDPAYATTYPDYVKIKTIQGDIILNYSIGNQSIYQNDTQYKISINKLATYENLGLPDQATNWNSFVGEIIIEIDSDFSVELYCDQSYYDEALGYQLNSFKPLLKKLAL